MGGLAFALCYAVIGNSTKRCRFLPISSAGAEMAHVLAQKKHYYYYFPTPLTRKVDPFSPSATKLEMARPCDDNHR